MKQFLRPTEVKIDNSKVFAELSITNDIINSETRRIVDIHIAPTLIETEIDNEGKYELPLATEILTKDKFNKFNKLTYSIGKINRLAEMNVDHLKSFIKLYFHFNDYLETTGKFKKCNAYGGFDISDDFSKLTFMQMRNLFSCLVKSDASLQSLEELDCGEKRNYITKVYADYVYDRDCYTHGQLFFHYPSFEPIIRVNPPNKKEHYIALTEEVLWDNLLTFKLLEKILTGLTEILNKQYGR